MTAVSRVTIHHEGAGEPTDDERASMKAGGYSIGLGITKFFAWRSPADSFGTFHFNGVSLDICFSGNRDNFDVTDDDLALLRRACADARARGWVAANATTHAHKETGAKHGPTACPGGRSMNRFADIVNAVNAGLSTSAPAQPSTIAVTHPVLRRHSTGPAVVELQHKLNVVAHIDIPENGTFGPKTFEAVQNFQRFFNLDDDGVCGKDTWALLDFLAALAGAH